MNEIKYPFLNLRDTNAPFERELADAALRVVASGRYVGGPENDAFEARLASICEVDHVVGVSNGLDALRLSLRAAVIAGRLNKGDAIAVAANTYVASVLAISDAGLTPILVDPDERTMNISADGLAKAVELYGAKGVMPVHLYGRVAWDEAMSRVVDNAGLFVIEDVAQAIGASCSISGERRNVGSLGDIAAFSFYPTKNIGALGDAGAVATSDAELAGIVRALANYGSDRRYHNIYQGFNCRLDPMQAAVLNVKLPSVNEVNAARRSKAAVYDCVINHPQVEKPLFDHSDDDSMVWHQYVVRHPRRDQFRQMLAERGVQTDIHYAVAPHQQPCYAGLAHGKLPTTERLAGEVVSLPIAESTTLDDARAIADIVNSLPIL